ncbi:hypothetical protein FCV25MIE_33233 [Fagus crenata]
MAPPTPPSHRHSRRVNTPYQHLRNNQHRERQLQPIPYHESEPIPFQHNWVLILRGRVRPIGKALVRWLQQCPSPFWRQVEAAMEQSLRDQIPQLPLNTRYGRIIVNLSTSLSIVCLIMTLQMGLPPRWREPQMVIRELMPSPTPITENNFDLNDVEALEAMTSIISLESTLLFLSFLARSLTVIVVEIHQRVLSSTSQRTSSRPRAI